MNINIKKTLKTILPISLGVFLVWYSYNSTSIEDRKQILYYIKEANLFWVSLSILFGILSHFSRAIRWNYLIEPLGYKPKISNNLLIVLMAYFANLGVPRTGEFLRATALTTYEDVPFEKGFGTIVTERVIDVLMLLLFVTTTLFLQTDVILGFIQEKGFNLNSVFLLIGLGTVGLLFFIFFIKKSTNAFAVKIKNFISGLLDGVLSIFKMKNKWTFVLHTLFIWFCYVAMLWVIKYAVPGTESLTISQLMVAFVAGTFAMAATNGGIGIYPIAISQALALYGISEVSGNAFGWIMWISQTAMIVVFGAISFLVLPLLNRK
ncbi:lysylphosphatidylglycerol synthase transmembrane domain-containing protein [uncultured Maribacter sp.]|uniref:lysylphosphatidylglycerol synthase transmembrane domain-containing protein n=1 Tax=uncultured Maribacter sp. TaxID=431308 RepID=UPI00261E2F16|nr:lysylphosphatidylglycerol synthase transmembrane domain-containing protein [uncultured Maribacter sp.]